MTRSLRLRALVPVLGAVFLAGCAGALNMHGYSGRRPPTYTVNPGDTLYSIAWHYGLDYHTVAVWNGIRAPYTIYPGEKIHLYPGSAHHAVASNSQPASSPAQAAGGRRGDRSGSGSASSGGTAEGPINWQIPGQGRIRATFGQTGIAGKGIVINGQLGEPVVAAASGTVVYVGSALVGYGRLIIIKHDAAWLSAYGHNQRLLVQEGEQVKAGQKIATMGLGSNDKPALYFEIRHDGKPVNPLHYLPKPG